MKRYFLPVLLILALWGSSLSCRAASSLFSTPTPTPTNTPLPTPTPRPTATPLPLSGETYSEQLPDGSQKFVDTLAGYQLILPPKWITLNLSTGDLEDIFSLAVATNPDMAGIIESSKQIITEGMQLLALDVNPNHITGESVPLLYSVLDTTSAGLPLDFLVQSTAQTIPGMMPGAKILSSSVTTNGNDVTIGILELTAPISNAQGNTILAYEKMVLLQSKGYTVMIIMTATNEMRPLMDSIFVEITNSIQLLP